MTERRSFLFLDPPDHTRLRGLVSRAFTARVVAAMHARLQGHVNRLLDAAEARGNLEIIDDLAYPLPFTVIAELLGIPISDLPLFRKWDREMAGANDPTLEPGTRRWWSASSERCEKESNTCRTSSGNGSESPPTT